MWLTHMPPTDSPDEARFREWLERFQPLLYKVVHSFAHSQQEERELFQDILVELWKSAPRFHGHSSASTWVYRVAFNTGMAWRRSETRRTTRHLPHFEWDTLPAPAPGRTGLIEELYAAIRQLSKAEAALVMMNLDGLSYREMAEITGLTETHIGAKLTRARARLGELMKAAIQ